jgi:hypothetical protein
MHNQALVGSGDFTAGIAEAFQLPQDEEGCNGVDTGQDQGKMIGRNRLDGLPGSLITQECSLVS